jgi:queuosine precursor transporter
MTLYMGVNELLLILTAAASAGFVYGAWRLDKERIYSIIVIFLILISVLGGKIVEFFGYQTNTGNIFYAAVFLATYFLIERYGRREGIRSIWIGVAGVLSFAVLLQLALLYKSVPATEGLGEALALAFEPISRLALASLLGYIASQSLNVYLYIYLKERFAGTRLWFRANLANLCAQILDSLIFFTVAFWGVVPSAQVYEVIAIGFIIKVLFMMAAAPLLYLNRVEEDEASGSVMMTLRYKKQL